MTNNWLFDDNSVAKLTEEENQVTEHEEEMKQFELSLLESDLAFLLS